MDLGAANMLAFETDPCHIDRVPELLDRLDRGNHKATFFVLGCIAAVQPGLVRLIAARGHEVAASMWNEDPAYAAERTWFRNQARNVKERLEDETAEPVLGFRAPGFSINSRNLWALETLAAEGFRYDSSIYAGLRWPPGILRWPREPKIVGTNRGAILEIPGWLGGLGARRRARPCPTNPGGCASSIRVALADAIASLSSAAPQIELTPGKFSGTGFRLWRWVFDPADWS